MNMQQKQKWPVMRLAISAVMTGAVLAGSVLLAQEPNPTADPQTANTRAKLVGEVNGVPL